MTPTGIDLKVIRDRSEVLAHYLELLRGLPVATFEAFVSDPRNPAAAESSIRRGLEALFDMLRHVLAKKYGDGSLQYREVARKAEQRGLVEGDIARRLEKMAGFRNRLVHLYAEVTHQELFDVVTRHLEDLEAVANAIRRDVSGTG